MDWFELEIKVPQEAADAVSHFLFELGAGGVTEDLNKSTQTVQLKAFFENAKKPDQIKLKVSDYLESIAKHFKGMGRVAVETRPVKEENWVEKYKEFYKAQPITHTFFLKPLWDDKTLIPIGMTPILMEPGQAFGTGLHPSTRLAIRCLEEALDLYPSREKVKLIDVGTGSGIIAIAAEKLGLKKLTAIDIDKVAVKTAKENFEHNSCVEIKVSDKPLSSFTKPYDIIVSNILLETHRHLGKHYKKLLTPGGFLILSGLLGSQRTETLELMQSLQFSKIMELSQQEWAAWIFTARRR